MNPTITTLERILVRKRFVARHLLFDPREDQPIVFDYGGERNVRVELRKPAQDDPERAYTTHDVLCSVSLAYSVPREHREDFVKLARGEPPKGSLAPVFGDTIDGRLLTPVPYRMLRSELKKFIDGIEAAAFDVVARTVRVLRWRIGAGGPHEPCPGGRS